MSRRVLVAAPRSFCPGVARLRLDPFFRSRLSPRAAEIAASAEESERGNLTVSPDAPSLAGALEARP